MRSGFRVFDFNYLLAVHGCTTMSRAQPNKQQSKPTLWTSTTTHSSPTTQVRVPPQSHCSSPPGFTRKSGSSADGPEVLGVNLVQSGSAQQRLSSLTPAPTHDPEIALGDFGFHLPLWGRRVPCLPSRLHLRACTHDLIEFHNAKRGSKLWRQIQVMMQRLSAAPRKTKYLLLQGGGTGLHRLLTSTAFLL